MIQELENIKLIRELNYLKSDFEYKTNLVQIYNVDFFNSIDRILNSNDELKKIYDEKNDSRFNYTSKSVTISEAEVSENVFSDSDSKLKSFYRQIVKMTHPDKVKNNNLNTIYSQASLAFKEGKTVDMILLCDRLNIPFEINQEEKEMLKIEIEILKNKISLIESSYSYQWANVDNEGVKSKIALNFIKNSIL